MKEENILASYIAGDQDNYEAWDTMDNPPMPKELWDSIPDNDRFYYNYSKKKYFYWRFFLVVKKENGKGFFFYAFNNWGYSSNVIEADNRIVKKYITE